MGTLGPGVLSAVVPLTIVVWLAALTGFFRSFLPRLSNRILISLALASSSLFCLFLLTPDIRQSLYWGQGMRSVVPPLMMGTVQIVLLHYIRSREWTSVQLWLWGILSFAWALVAGGFSETYAAFQVAALTISLTMMLMFENPKFSSTTLFLGTGLLGAFFALILVILAPGNAERQSFFPPPPGLASMLAISLKSYLIYLAELVNLPARIAAILGLFSLAALAGSQLKQGRNARLVWIVPSLMLVFTFICFPPAAYGTSEAPPNRTLILPTYFFIVGIVIWGIVSGNLLGKKQNVLVSTLLPVLATVTIAGAALIHSISLYQSRTEFIDYAQMWDQTEASILTSKQNGASQVLIPVTQNWASLNTPNDNPRFWVNVCMSRYYDVQILATTESISPSP